METINKLMMFAIGVNDMPRAKAFYGDKLGFKINTDYRQDDDHWWVSLLLPEGGVTITLTTYHGNTQPCPMTLWFGTKDLNSLHETLGNKGIIVSEIQDDLHGPGSGVIFRGVTCCDLRRFYPTSIGWAKQLAVLLPQIQCSSASGGGGRGSCSHTESLQ